MIYDISPLLCPTTPVWPGDRPLQRQLQMELANGDSVLLSSLDTTVHIGAHADAPNHYHAEGLSIDQVDLDPYIGPCEVVGVPRVTEILEDHCRCVVARGARRVLFRTGSFDHAGPFQENFCYFSEQAVRFMGQNGIRLIGIDTPSVDSFASKTLPSHQQLYAHDMRNLEGLNLSEVPDGLYELIALPLKLKGFDASPVRAILRNI